MTTATATATAPATGRGRRFVVLLATLVGIAATARLGWWQADRASEKRALQIALDTRASMPPLVVAQLATTSSLASQQHYRQVRLTGRWLPAHTVFLENRQMNGRPGFVVVTPLQLSGRGEAVLVQRGWAPRNIEDRSAVPLLPDVAGQVSISGRVAPPPGRLYDFGSPGTGTIRQNLPLDAFAEETRLALLPMSIEQADSPSTAGDGLQRAWAAPALDIDRHYGYMVQWFALSALIAGLYLWFQVIAPATRRWRSRSGANGLSTSSSTETRPIAHVETQH